MKINDKRIAHLKNLGKDRNAAIRSLKRKMQKDPGFLEVAEISFSHMTRDGGLTHKDIAYVAGICGRVPAKGANDYRDEIYHLIYFQEMGRLENGALVPEGTIYSNNLERISEYQPFSPKAD